MLNPENPSHQAVIDIEETERETFRTKLNITAETIPQLIGFSTEDLTAMDYMLLAMQYEQFINDKITELMLKK